MPEDRLRATYIGGLVFVPMSILLSGFITHFIPGTLGIVLNLMCLFMNGIGVSVFSFFFELLLKFCLTKRSFFFLI